MTKVYLAGGKSQGWRRRVRLMWRQYDVETHDPFTQSRQGAAYEFTNDDLQAIRESDIVFAVVDYPVFTGLAAEVGFAHALGIPVFIVWDVFGGQAPYRIESFVTSCAKALFVSVDEAARFVRERYLKRSG